jgi:rhodanese-related sulfurtransferase
MGSMQAIEAIKYLVDINMSQKLIMYDSLNSSIHEIHTEISNECLVCGDNKIISAISCVKEYKEYVEDPNNKILLDIRKSYNQDYEILNSIQISPEEITDEYLKSSGDISIYILCDFGEQSVHLAQKIRNMGYNTAWSINGGCRKVFS